MIRIDIGSAHELVLLFALIRGDHDTADKLRKEINSLDKDTDKLQQALDKEKK